MKTTIALAVLCAIGIASCDNGTNTTAATTTNTDTVVAPPAADPNMVTTTTTTTTTRPAFQPRQGVQYMDLRTKKLVTVRVDTVHHYVVNAATNQPLDFFIEPGTTDTFYGRNMQVANGYINYGSGNDWRYDESRANNSMNSSDMNSTTTATDNPNTSTGSTGSDVKKIKTNGNETKIKTTDGSKMKSNSNETKIKNK